MCEGRQQRASIGLRYAKCSSTFFCPLHHSRCFRRPDDDWPAGARVIDKFCRKTRFRAPPLRCIKKHYNQIGIERTEPVVKARSVCEIVEQMTMSYLTH